MRISRTTSSCRVPQYRIILRDWGYWIVLQESGYWIVVRDLKVPNRNARLKVLNSPARSQSTKSSRQILKTKSSYEMPTISSRNSNRGSGMSCNRSLRWVPTGASTGSHKRSGINCNMNSSMSPNKIQAFNTSSFKIATTVRTEIRRRTHQRSTIRWNRMKNVIQSQCICSGG